MACLSIIPRCSDFRYGFSIGRGHGYCLETNVAIKETIMGPVLITTWFLRTVAMTAVLLIICIGCSSSDNSESLNWYRENAEKGYPEAQYNLGVLYATGRGVMLSHTEAVKWYRLAADQGLPNAQFNLGVSYANGEGIPQNHVRAYMWWSLAKAQGHDMAAKYMVSIKRTMATSDISKAQQLAEDWWNNFNRR